MLRPLKVIVGVNTLQSVGQYVYAAHSQMWAHIGRLMAREGHTIYNFTPPRMSIDRMRNTAARTALENDLDYILFIDDDVLAPPSAVQQILEAMEVSQYDVLAGHTIIRGYPFNSMAFIKDGKGGLRFYNECNELDAAGGYKHCDENGIVACDAIGFSFAALRVSSLRQVEPPYFITAERGTEDIYYCVKLRIVRPDAKIGVMPHIETGHCGEPKIYTPRNRHLYKVLEEMENPDLEKIAQPQDWRGEEYLRRCEALLSMDSEPSI